MTIEFLSNGIKEVKTNISTKKSIESQVERFRQDMLAKHNLLFTNTPHILKIKY